MKQNWVTRGLAMGLALAMTMSLAACQDKDSSSGPESSSTAGANASGESSQAESGSSAGAQEPLGKYDELVEISMYGQVDSTMNFENNETYEDNLWSRLYEDKLNIKIVYKWIVNNDQYEQKMNVSIASKDFADVMYFGISDKNFALLANNGQLQDLGAVYDQYASDFTKQIHTDAGEVAMDSGKIGGVQYGIPNTNASIEAAQILWLRQDWLDELNETVPSTMDELLAISKKFMEADLAKVGSTWAFGMDKALTTISGYFAAYGGYLKQWIERDGSIVYSSIQPEVRTALESLQKLYKDGMLDKEFAVKDNTKMCEDVNAGKCGILWGGHASPLYPLNASHDNDPKVDWTPVPITSATGEKAVQYVGISAGGHYTVSKDCKNPEAMIKLMNLFTETCFSEDMNPLYYITNDQYREPFKHARVQTWPITKNVDIYKRIQEGTDKNDESIINANEETKQMYAFCKQFNETGVDGWDYARVFGVGGSEAVMSGYLDNDQLQYVAFYGTPTETMTSKLSSLQKQEEEVFTQIVMGEADISAFDKFVEDWKSLGGDQITKEVNEWKAAQ